MGGGAQSSGSTAMKDQYGEVAVKRDIGDAAHPRGGHVAVLTIDRPPHNHVTVELMRNLADALDHVDAERELRASVLTTAGKSFCAGADLVSPSGIANPNAKEGINALYVEAVRLVAVRQPILFAGQGSAGRGS